MKPISRLAWSGRSSQRQIEEEERCQRDPLIRAQRLQDYADRVALLTLDGTTLEPVREE